VRRSEIWTATAGSGYAGKPRPVVIIQDERFDATDSVTVCAFTTDPTEAPLIRLLVEPDDINGLRERCSLMVDKIITIPRSKLGEHVGRLSDDDMVRLGRAVLVFSAWRAERFRPQAPTGVKHRAARESTPAPNASPSGAAAEHSRWIRVANACLTCPDFQTTPEFLESPPPRRRQPDMFATQKRSSRPSSCRGLKITARRGRGCETSGMMAP